ncbi:MAG: CDP-diacylglycerol--serine O-phosphatidyltransferase [Bacteroidales bacterium]|nr:CDP-diacylglycerol--serine O-phosphatidyltransferase [Bacteroidales bacterium]
MRHIPNTITILNLASGFVAIILILNQNIVTGCWIVVAAMVFDFSDGFAARLLNAYSDLGKELDSIADVVSFGVAPGLIIYELFTGTGNPGLSVLFIAISTLFPVCAGLRLARFNIDTDQTHFFRGLPTPAAALSVISIVFALEYGSKDIINNFIESKISLAIFTLTISILMVSRLPMITLKMKCFKLKGNEVKYLLLVVCIIFVLFFGIEGLTLFIPAYIILSIIASLFKVI